MKITLKRFCPKGCATEQVSYKDMLEKFLTQTSGTLPTAKQIKDGNYIMLYHHVDGNNHLYILENGLVLYTQPIDTYVSGSKKNKLRTTVIAVNKVKFIYSSCTDSEKTTIPETEYLYLPFYTVLLMFATIRMQHNVDSKEKTNLLNLLNNTELLNNLSKTSPDYLLDIENAIDNQVLFEAINDLTDKQKEAVYLRYFERLTQKQIAQRLNIERVSVQSRLISAEKALRKNKKIQYLR